MTYNNDNLTQLKEYVRVRTKEIKTLVSYLLKKAKTNKKEVLAAIMAGVEIVGGASAMTSCDNVPSDTIGIATVTNEHGDVITDEQGNAITKIVTNALKETTQPVDIQSWDRPSLLLDDTNISEFKPDDLAKSLFDYTIDDYNHLRLSQALVKRTDIRNNYDKLYSKDYPSYDEYKSALLSKSKALNEKVKLIDKTARFLNFEHYISKNNSSIGSNYNNEDATFILEHKINHKKADVEEYEKGKAIAQTIIADIKETLPSNTSEREMAEIILDKLCSMSDFNGEQNKDYAIPLAPFSLGPITNGTGNQLSFARAYLMLLKEAGINCIAVATESKNLNFYSSTFVGAILDGQFVYTDPLVCDLSGDKTKYFANPELPPNYNSFAFSSTYSNITFPFQEALQQSIPNPESNLEK